MRVGVTWRGSLGCSGSMLTSSSRSLFKRHCAVQDVVPCSTSIAVCCYTYRTVFVCVCVFCQVSISLVFRLSVYVALFTSTPRQPLWSSSKLSMMSVLMMWCIDWRMRRMWKPVWNMRSLLYVISWENQKCAKNLVYIYIYIYTFTYMSMYVHIC